MANKLFDAMSGLDDSVNGSYYDETTNEVVANKVEQLKQQREKKLYKLGKLKQNANLDPNSFTELPNGNIEHNGNKIWNNANAADIQMAMSDAVNQQIYTRDDGSKYQIDKMGYERDYNGQTQRAYMYGTKNGNSVKFGLASGKLPNSDYRYLPGKAYEDGLGFSKDYGWDSGEHGVDLSKKYLDIELPYNVATALEGLVHGRMGAIANREYPDMLDPNREKTSGASEYYNSLEGMLGDSRGQEASKDHILERYAKLKEAQAPAPYGGAKEEIVPDHNIARGFGSSVINLMAKGQALIGEAYKTAADWQEASLKRREADDLKHPNRQHGIFEDTFADWEKSAIKWMRDRGRTIQKEMTQYQLNNDADKVTGYSHKDVDALSKEVDETIKNEGWVSAIAKVVTDKRSLEVLTNSIPDMVALGASVGTMAIVNANNNINLGEAQIGRKFTPDEKVKSVATSIVSTYLDRVGDKIAMSGMNPSKKILKTAIEKAPNSVKSALASKFGKGILTIGKEPVKLVGAGIVEGSTEKAQTLGEIAAQNPDIFKDGYTQEQLDQSNVAGVLGFGMGAQMHAGMQGIRTAPKVAEYVKETYDDKLDLLSDSEDTTVPSSFKGLKNRFESVQSPNFEPSSDPKAKEAYTKSGIEYAIRVITNPSKRDGVYKNKPQQVINDLVDNISKLHGVKTETGKGVVWEEVISKLYDTTRAKDKDTGKTLLNSDDKEAVLQSLKDSFDKRSTLSNGEQTLLSTIRGGEGTSDDLAVSKGYKSGYDVTLGHGKFVDDKTKPITDMTIKEVFALQKEMKKHKDNKFWTGKYDANGNKKMYSSSAVGAYQIVEPTLRELVKELGIKETDKFTPELQDKMALHLIKKPLKDFKSGKITETQLQDKIAKVWASVATTEDKSAYGQHTGTDSNTILNAIKAYKEDTAFDTTVNKYATRALEEEMKTDLTHRIDDIRKGLKNDFSDPLAVATDEELQSLLDVTQSMKTFGSEALTESATRIENALIKIHDTLGSTTLDENGKPPAKKMSEVSKEIETLGFLYEGRNFKSIREHARDLDLYVVNGTKETEKQANETLKALEVFTANRGIDKLKAINGNTKDLFAVGQIVSLNSKKLKETSKLLDITDKALESNDLSKEHRTRLEDIQKSLQDSIKGHKEIAELAKTKQYATLYKKIANDDTELVDSKLSQHKIGNANLKDIIANKESLQAIRDLEEEQADSIVNEESIEEEPTREPIDMEPTLPTPRDVAIKMVSKQSLTAEDLQVQANESKALEQELQSIYRDNKFGKMAKEEEVSLGYKSEYEHVERFLNTTPTSEQTIQTHEKVKKAKEQVIESEKEVSSIDGSIGKVEEAKSQITEESDTVDEAIQTVLNELESLQKQRGIIQGKVDRLKKRIQERDKQRRRIYNAKKGKGTSHEKTAKAVLKEVYNRLVESVDEALDYIKKYRKALNTRLRKRQKELKTIDDRLRNFYTPKEPAKSKIRKETQADKVRKASEPRIGESKDEAKERVKSIFKSSKLKEETYSDEDIEYLDSLEEEPFGFVPSTNSKTESVKSETKSEHISTLKTEIKESSIPVENTTTSIEETLSELEQARQRVLKAKKRLDALEEQRISGKRLTDSMLETLASPLEEAKYQYTLIKNEVKNLQEKLKYLKGLKNSDISKMFEDEKKYQDPIDKEKIKKIKNNIKQLMMLKERAKRKTNSLSKELDKISRHLKEVKNTSYEKQLPLLSKILKKVLSYVDEGIAILLDYKNTVIDKIKQQKGIIRVINEELSKNYENLETLEKRLEARKVFKKATQVKKELSETYDKLNRAKKDKQDALAKLQSKKAEIKATESVSKRVHKELQGRAKEELAKAVENLVKTRRKIEKRLGKLVIPNNATEIGVSSVLSSDLSMDEKVEYLAELMPRIIRESEDGGRARIENAIETFEAFAEQRPANFVSQEGGSSEDRALNPLLQKIFGSDVASMMSNIENEGSKKYQELHGKADVNEAKHAVRTAMHMASIMTLADMTGLRHLRGEKLTKLVKGAFGRLLTGDKMLSAVKLRKLKTMVSSGEIVPEATFAMSAGREFVKQLEIRFDTKSKITGQTEADITTALGYLVIDNLLPSSRGMKHNNDNISKKVVTYTEKDGVVIEFKEKQTDGNGVITNVIDLRDLSEDYIKDIVSTEATFAYVAKQDNGMISREPKMYKEGKLTKNSKVPIPKGAIEYLNKQNAKAWRFSDSFERFWSNFEGTHEQKVEALTEEILGTLDEIVANSTTMEVESNIAAYKANALAIERMMMAYEISGGKDFYIDWNYTVSGRSMMDNKMIAPQSSGISRFVVEMNGMSNEVNKNDFKDNDLYAIKAAMAQAFDVGRGIDKDTDENVFKELEKLVVLTNKDGKLKATFPEGSPLPKLMKRDFSVYSVKEAKLPSSAKSILHVYQVIDFLNMVQDPTVDTFNTNLALEADGITNGMSAVLMQMGWSKFTIKHLERTGVYGEDSKYSNHGEFKSDGGNDVYQAPIPDVQEALGSEITRLISDIVGPNWRNFMKNPIMIFIYGANLNKIIDAVAMSLTIGNSYINGGLASGKFDKLKELALQNLEDLSSVQYNDLTWKEKKELKQLRIIQNMQPRYKKYDLETGKFIELHRGDEGYLDTKYAYLTDAQIATLASGVSSVIGDSFKSGFTKTFKDITKYRQALKMVEEVNYSIFKVAFREKLLERGIINDRMGELTSKQLTEVLNELMKEGTYYSSKSAVKGKGEQDFFKTDVMEGTEDDILRVKLSPSKYQSGTGFYSTINKVVKDLKANVGSVGVTHIHGVDGNVMIEGHINDVLNVFDALVMGSNAEQNTESVQALNQSFYNISMRHSILGNAVEKLVKNGPKYTKALRDSGLGNELFQDIERIFEISKSESDILTEDRFVDDVIKTLEKTDEDRRALAKQKLKVNQYYVTDDIKAIEGTTDESTLKRHAVFSNDPDLIENEKDVVRQMLKTLIAVANEGVPKEEVQEDTKPNKDIITKEQIPDEIAKLLDNIKDIQVKKFFKNWVDTKLKEMEIC